MGFYPELKRRQDSQGLAGGSLAQVFEPAGRAWRSTKVRAGILAMVPAIARLYSWQRRQTV